MRFRFIPAIVCLFILCLKTDATAAPAKAVHLLTYEGIINPVSSELFLNAIANAEKDNASALIIQLDTPGGLDTSMREIVKAIDASRVPVIIYVSPSGGRAASAGVFITLAAHIAAMAPGTNIGAAHPVAMGGQTMDEETKQKVENDAAAYIRSIAEKRGRDSKWAEAAVRKSVSVTEKEALNLKIIDFVSESITDLVKQIDGRSVTTVQGEVVLSTAGATIIKQELGFRHKILKAISDPDVAYILMLLGTTGLIAELYSPGAIFPGVLGSICLILAFYSFQTLPVNGAGLLLIFLSIVLFIAEMMVPGFGVLAFGGVTALLIGSLMLFDTPLPILRVSPTVLSATIIPIAIIFVFIVQAAWRAQRAVPITEEENGEGLVGAVGVAQGNLTPTGTIKIHGELWQAETKEQILAGEGVEVIKRTGLTLQVKKV
ncbi:MAG: nodulation protein NfeD [Nitrospirae bacterium]|nr:nodulation protein NfeD [Candidatus Troglogloeales bacterium]